MCEVLSDVHTFNKFDLIPDTGNKKAISRFQFYFPRDTSNSDVKEPPKKKLKQSRSIKGTKFVERNCKTLKMCEVLSDVHTFNKFDLIPDTGNKKAISRFQFYFPRDTSNSDVKEPPKKKLKQSRSIKGTKFVERNCKTLLCTDEDGDLVVERHPRILVPKTSESSDQESEEEPNSSEEEPPVRVREEFQRIGSKTNSLDHNDTHTRIYEHQCIITLKHSLATDLAEVGEQVWLGALLLCDFMIYRSRDFREKTVVDLGAGTGLTSIVAGLFANKVYYTDVGESILDIAKHNITNQILLQEHGLCEIQVRELDWLKPVKESEDSGPYGLTADDVSQIYSAEIIIAADVIYDNNITDAFINTVTSLMSKPPNKQLFIGLEKRIVFTIEDLDVASPAYEHFRRKLKELETLPGKGQVTIRVKQIETDFPQYFQYNRIKQLELWSVAAVFDGT